MAVTNIHPIKSTLKKAIDYICNPEKTDGRLLISSYQCVPEIADIEFEFERKKAINKGNNLAHHLIQAFDPDDDITSEQAHDIGKQLAEKVFGGKYQYVLTTHIDKGHIHNHLIINAVDLERHRKYESNIKSYFGIRNLSDELCIENNLSVIKDPQHGSKDYKEWYEDKNGTSYKTRLKNNIDKTILESSSYQEFLDKMHEVGYELKFGKHISFRFSDQERFTRSKTLGDLYTEEKIKERIYTRVKGVEVQKPLLDNLVDMESEKIKTNAGLEHWAKIKNLKESASTILYMQNLGIHTPDELESRLEKLSQGVQEYRQEIKQVENRMKVLSQVFKAVETYKEKKIIRDKMDKVFFKDKFAKEHESDLRLFESSKKQIKDFGIKSLKEISTLKDEYSKLETKSDVVYKKYYESKKQKEELQTAKRNIEMLERAKKINDFELNL